MKKNGLVLVLALSFLANACSQKTSDKTDNKNSTENKESENKEEDKKDKKTPASLDGWEIVPQKQVGKVTPKTAYKDLLEAYGKENLKKGEFCIEGDCQNATTVSEEGKEMVLVVWADESKKAVKFVEIISPRIKLPNGTHIGTTLKTLVKYNGGKPIKFSGFDWGMAGNIQDYNGGALAKTTKDFACILEQDKGDATNKQLGITEAQATSVMGDVSLMSNNPIFEKLPVKVGKIQVFFR